MIYLLSDRLILFHALLAVTTSFNVASGQEEGRKERVEDVFLESSFNHWKALYDFYWSEIKSTGVSEINWTRTSAVFEKGEKTNEVREDLLMLFDSEMSGYMECITHIPGFDPSKKEFFFDEDLMIAKVGDTVTLRPFSGEVNGQSSEASLLFDLSPSFQFARLIRLLEPSEIEIERKNEKVSIQCKCSNGWRIVASVDSQSMLPYEVSLYTQVGEVPFQVLTASDDAKSSVVPSGATSKTMDSGGNVIMISEYKLGGINRNSISPIQTFKMVPGLVVVDSHFDPPLVLTSDDLLEKSSVNEIGK